MVTSSRHFATYTSCKACGNTTKTEHGECATCGALKPALPAPETEIDCLRAELAEARRALLAGNDTVLANKKLQEDNAAKDARIAEFEAMVDQLETESMQKDALTANMLKRRNARIAELETVKIASTEINAMPSYVRGYIAALETACDPNGTIRENYTLREENLGLRTECANLHARAERAEARIAELEAGQICGACGQPWDGQGCAQKDNGHPFQTCYPVVNESPMRARAERAEAAAACYARQVGSADAENANLRDAVKRAEAERDAAKAHVVDLEEIVKGVHFLRKQAEARVAEFADKGTLQALRDANGRAERAEAELKIKREALELVDADVRHHLRSDAIDHALLRKHAVAAVRAALAPSPAGREG